MADTNNTNEEHIDGTRYIPIGEYDNLLKSYHELDGELQREVSKKNGLERELPYLLCGAAPR